MNTSALNTSETSNPHPKGGGRGRASGIGIAIAMVLVAGALAAAFFWWRTEWAPLQRALQVAEILGGREADARRAGKGIAALGNLGLTVRGIAPAEYTVDRATWASTELQSLANSYPRALAIVAARERAPDVRFAFLDLVETHRSYDAEVPAERRLEHVVSHVSKRLDRRGSRPMTDGQKALLMANRDDAIPSLRKMIRVGHCGALEGFDLLKERVGQDDLLAAGRAIAREGSNPLGELTPTEQEECLARFAERGAPVTDGDFGVSKGGLDP